MAVIDYALRVRIVSSSLSIGENVVLTWSGDTIETMPPTGRFVPSADEVDDGWALTCQSIPTSREVVITYDR